MPVGYDEKEQEPVQLGYLTMLIGSYDIPKYFYSVGIGMARRHNVSATVQARDLGALLWYGTKFPTRKRRTAVASKEKVAEALAQIDWGQVVANGGPPCFHVEVGRFCLRAERWVGHGQADHPYVSLADFVQVQLAASQAWECAMREALEALPARIAEIGLEVFTGYADKHQRLLKVARELISKALASTAPCPHAADTERMNKLEALVSGEKDYYDILIQSDEDDGIWVSQCDTGLHGCMPLPDRETKSTTVRESIDAVVLRTAAKGGKG